MTTRYAPTLFVGLGGSGIKVLRWVKTRMIDGRADDSVLDKEPVAFLGIDFDKFSNNAAGPLLPLDDKEFHHFAASGIAEQINHIDRTRDPVPENGDEDGVANFEFEEVREWYPDPEQKAIRYAQSEATGAAQWRPLGRIGFYLYDHRITEALSLALTNLDNKRAHSAGLGEQPTVFLVSSLSGGTGSAILFDIAVAIRKIRRGIPVRAILLLPEIFEHVDFRDRIFPNAYATLSEIANLKNQHVVFQARYPRIPPVSPSDSPAPFQRVYVLGPWMGDRRPFYNPDDAYPHLGDLLRLTITREIRAAALTSEANAAADTGAPLNSPTSRDVFCTMSALGIRLLRYRELADLIVGKFIEELEPRGPRPTIEMFAPTPSDDAREEIAKWITTAYQGGDSNFVVDRGVLVDRVRGMLASELRYGETWSPERLQRLVDTIHRFIGTDPSVGAKHPPEIAASVRDRFRDALSNKLIDLRNDTYARSPRAFETLLQDLKRQLPEPRIRRSLKGVEFLEGVPRWLTGKTVPGSFAHGVTPAHIASVRESVAEWARVVPEDIDMKTWLAQAVIAGANEAIQKLLADEEKHWSRVADLRTLASKRLSTAGSERDPDVEHLLLDCRRGDIQGALEAELNRVGRDRRQTFVEQFLSRFDQFYRDFISSSISNAKQFDDWLKSIRDFFERELSVVNREKEPNVKERNYKFIAPEVLFTPDQIKLAMFRLSTRVFQPGRVQARATARLARLLVPQGFAGRDELDDRLRSWCRSLLGATASSTSEESPDVEDRIVIVLDDLFHPAEDLTGIYDYYAQYAAQPDPLLFHIHKDWPRQFTPLVTRAGNRSPVNCGNAGCSYDLRHTPRTTLFCPGCNKPVQNRCGNSRCVIDDLSTRPDRARFIESRACPGCRKPLRTYFWQCPTHREIPMDKESCPYCVAEGRPEEEISRRPDRTRRFICPGCVARGFSDPFTTTGDLARFLRDGVNGHDTVIAEKLFAEALHGNGRCPRCGTETVPICPERDATTPQPHYLHRRGAGGRFRCYSHTSRIFFTCQKCEFPLQPHETHCRRCGIELDDCRFCTPGRSLRIPKGSPDDRCPFCKLPRSAPAHRKPRQVFPAPDDDLFCPNIFGCAAGARLDEATLPAGTCRCGVCGDSELTPLFVSTREHHLARCWFCRAIFGLDGIDLKNGEVAVGGTDDLDEPRTPVEKEKEPCPDDHSSSEVCCLCGFSQTLTFELGQASQRLPTSPLSDDKLKSMATAFVLIGKTLRCTLTAEEAFRCLMGDYYRLFPHDFEHYLICFTQRMLRREIQRIAGKRIDGILRLYRTQLGCRHRASSSGDPAECNCKK